MMVALGHDPKWPLVTGLLTLVANSARSSEAAIFPCQGSPFCPGSGPSAIGRNSPPVSLLGLPADLVVTLRELTELRVGFVSLAEALDLTTPSGRAMTGMLAVFADFEREILRERVHAGIAQARKEGRKHGRPRTASLKTDEVHRLRGLKREHRPVF
jgi:hypothetical protein